MYDLSLPEEVVSRLLRAELYRQQRGLCHWCRRRCLPGPNRKVTTGEGDEAMTGPTTFDEWTRLVIDREDPYGEGSRRESERRLVREKYELLRRIEAINAELTRLRGIK